MTSISSFNKTELALLHFLKLSLQQTDSPDTALYLTEKEWDQVVMLADRHEVLALLTPVLDPDRLSEKQQLMVELKTARTIQKGIQLQALNARLTGLLKGEGIMAVTLKGCAVARLYPVPEYRKTTDIDLFVDNRKAAEQAVQILCANGFRLSKEWHANHHFVLLSERNEEVELHTTWTEDFKEKRLNQYLEKLQKESSRHCQPADCQGFQIYGYETAWQGFYLLIHMLLHFVGSGFGLRNLCDWVVLWEQCNDAKARQDFWKLVCESGTVKFAKAVTVICEQYLGLDRDKSPVPTDNPQEQEAVDVALRGIIK